MKKLIKISISTAFFIIGIVVAFYSADFFSEEIRNLYKWFSNGNVHFAGKYFNLWAFNPIYFLSFGIVFLISSLEVTSLKISRITKNLFLQFSIFMLIIICISFFDTNRRLITCTTCNDGVLVLSRGYINYALILIFSILCSSIPTLVRMIRNKRKIAQN